MRQLWCALGIFGGMLLFILWSGGWLMDTVQPVAEGVNEISAAVREGAWDRAERKTQETLDAWERAVPRLRLFQSHEDVDEVSILLQEAQMALICREPGEYGAVSVRLLGALEKLCAMERLSVGNLF